MLNAQQVKHIILIAITILSATTSFAQQSEKEAITKTINTMFDGMRKGDSTMLRLAFHKDMVLQSVAAKKDGTVSLQTDKADDFIKVITTPHQQIYDERITITSILVDGELASVWAPYKFYLGPVFNHCGVDVFQLMKTKQGWKIIYIADTRRKDNCPD